MLLRDTLKIQRNPSRQVGFRCVSWNCKIIDYIQSGTKFSEYLGLSRLVSTMDEVVAKGEPKFPPDPLQNLHLIENYCTSLR